MRTYIKAVAAAAGGSVGAKLTRTGQTISYRTGDDGDLELGRDTSFTVLGSNNPFGNTNRFTDELGTLVYANNIIIDWSTYNGTTVVGWYKGAIPIEIWNAAIDNAIALTVATFVAWRIPYRKEYAEIVNDGINPVLNYTPFNNSTISVAWTTTTNVGATSNAQTFWSDGTMQARGKTSTSYSLRCRTFTVTGTTLT